MLKDSFKRGLGYQFARLVITLAIAFIIALLSGKVHALSWDLDFQKESKVFDQSKLVQITVTGAPSSSAPLNPVTANFDYNFVNTDDYDFIVIPISFTVRGKNGTTSSGDYWANIIDSGMRIQLISNGSWSNCESQNNFLVCPLIDDLTYSGIRFYFTKAYTDDSSYYVTLNSYVSLYNSNNSTAAKNSEEIKNSTKETEKNTKETKDFITDDSDPNVDVSDMGGINGLLPAGPLDSLLALPINLITILQNSTSGTCTPFTFNFVFDSQWSLPCFDEFWNEVPTALLLFISDLPAVYIFIKWAKSIYTRVERAVSFESSVNDEWGGV